MTTTRAILALVLCLAACADFDEGEEPEVESTVQALAGDPVITSLSTTSGTVGAQVTITGANLPLPNAGFTLRFGSTSSAAASYVRVDASKLIATVPPDARTGNVYFTAPDLLSPVQPATRLAAKSPEIYTMWRAVDRGNQEVGDDIAVDGRGHLYLTGYLFGPNVGFVEKWTTGGSLVWGQSGDWYAETVGYSPSDDCVVIGGNEPWPGRQALVRKFNTNGVLQWTVHFGDADSQPDVNDLAVDRSGNIFVSGEFEDTMSYEGGAQHLTSTGHRDGYLAKLDRNGALLWWRRYGGTSQDGLGSIALTANGEVVVGGYFNGTVVLGPTTLVAQSFDPVVVRVDAAGAPLWAQNMGTPRLDGFWPKVAIDGGGRVVAAATIPVRRPTPLNPLRDSDQILLAVFDSTGAPVWASMYGGPDYDEGAGALVTESSNIVLLARYSGNQLDFGGGALPAVTGVALPGTALVKFTSTGALVKTEVIDAYGAAMARDKSSTWVTGIKETPNGNWNYYFSEHRF